MTDEKELYKNIKLNHAGKEFDDYRNSLVINSLTLRRFYAGMALQGILAAQMGAKYENGCPVFESGWPVNAQKTAFLIADAMIAEEKK